MNSDIELVAAICAAVMLIDDDPITQHNSVLTGKMKYHELITSENVALFSTACHMPRHCFLRLLDKLKSESILRDGKKVCAGEKLMIFLQIVCHASYVRKTAMDWQHSTDTIHNALYEVIRSILSVAHSFVPSIRAADSIPEKIRSNPKFFP